MPNKIYTIIHDQRKELKVIRKKLPVKHPTNQICGNCDFELFRDCPMEKLNNKVRCFPDNISTQGYYFKIVK